MQHLADFENDVCINEQGKTFQMLKCSCWSSTTLIISSSFILLGERMRVLRTASILVLSTFLLAGFSATLAASNEVPQSGIRQGDWAKYIGSLPCEEYEWIHLSFLRVKGYLVNISMRYDLRWQYRQRKIMDIGQTIYGSYQLTSSARYRSHPRQTGSDYSRSCRWSSR